MSRTIHSEHQMDMRNIPAFMPDVELIQVQKDTKRSRAADVASTDVYFSETGIALLREKLIIESIHSVLDKRCSKKTWEDVMSWLLSDDATNPFSFLVCCDQIGVDPYRYREAVIDMIQRRCNKQVLLD